MVEHNGRVDAGPKKGPMVMRSAFPPLDILAGTKERMVDHLLYLLMTVPRATSSDGLLSPYREEARKVWCKEGRRDTTTELR